MSDFDLLPDQPTAWEHLRRFGPPAVLALVAFLFIVQNTASVSFHFLWFEFRWPLWIMLLAFMATGVGVFFGVARRRRWLKERAERGAE